MIPYKIDKIQTMADVKKEFPKMFDINNLKNIFVKRFIREEIEKYNEDIKAKAEFYKTIELKPEESNLKTLAQFVAFAEVRALYKYYWCHYNVLDQICKYRFTAEDVNPIMMRMEKTKKFDPWSTTEPTAGMFIESLEDRGHRKVVTKDGYEFYVKNPRGYKVLKKDTEDINTEELEEQIEDEKEDIQELWKPVKEFPGYQVSNLGRVMSKNKRIRKPYKRNDGYMDIALHKNGASYTHKVHRLVAEAFIPNPDKKLRVNHINGIKDCNRAENLEWVTDEENVKHALITGLAKHISNYIEN